LPLLEVKNLKKYFLSEKGISNWLPLKKKSLVRAVDGVTFEIESKKTLGLVGESGCGKTTVARTILRLIEPTSGKILFEGQDLARLSRGKMKKYRRKMQIIFQDPFLSLNPRMRVGDIIEEALKIHGLFKGEESKRVDELMQIVGLKTDYKRKYPHEFSGGERQRIGIARALIVEPKLIIGDEPVTSLDVSIQSRILNLMKDLQEKFKLTMLFISHDLRVVRFMSNHIAVMYCGKIVEIGEAEEIFGRPVHPYTQALMSAIPLPDPELKRSRILLKEEVPSPINPPSGCRFHPRCEAKIGSCCEEEIPNLISIGNKHFVACHMFSR